MCTEMTHMRSENAVCHDGPILLRPFSVNPMSVCTLMLGLLRAHNEDGRLGRWRSFLQLPSHMLDTLRD